MRRFSARRLWKGRVLWTGLLVAAVAAALALWGGPIPAGPTASARSDTVVNANDYSSIQAAVDSLRSTGGAVYIPAGVHVVSAKIRIYSNITVFGDGIDQTIIKPADTMDDHLLADDSASSRDTNIVVRDLTLQGPGRSSAKTGCCHGLRFVNLTDSAVINVKSDNHSTDGIYLGYYNTNNVTNVRVSGCQLTNNGRNGYSLTHGTGNIIDDCLVENNNEIPFSPAGIDFEPDDGLDVSGNRAVSNSANEQNVGIQLYSFNRTQATQGNNSICTNTARLNRTAGFYDFNGNKNVYVNNTATDNGGSGQVNFVLDSSAVFSTDFSRYCSLPALPSAPPKPGSTATPTPTGTPTPVVATPTPTSAPLSPPAAPTLSARAGKGSVRLSWTASSTAGVTYNVYRGTSSLSEVLLCDAQGVCATGVSGTRYDDRAVQGGTTYYYQVTAVNAAGESRRSNEVSAKPR